MALPFQVWVVVGDHFQNVTKMEDLPQAVEFVKYYIGNEPLKNSFLGFVTAISTKSILANTPTINASCSMALYHDENYSFEDNYGKTDFTFMEEQRVCSEQMYDITLYGPQGYSDFRKMCSSLGGRFPKVKEVVAEELDNSSCVSEEGVVSWLGGGEANEEDVWSSCPALHGNGKVSERSCMLDLPCCRCRVPLDLRYVIYGPVQHFDRIYFLKMLPDGSFYFKGRHSSNISRLDDGWTLWSRMHHRWWRLGQGSWPLGRRPWYSPHVNTTLTFTSCTNYHFPVDDGTCLSRNQRCNGKQDHSDGSDERACHDKLVTKNSDYLNKILFDDPDNEVLNHEISLININDITAAQGIADFELNVKITWDDSRITLVDVNHAMTKDYLFPCDNIWTPQLQLLSGGQFGSYANFSYILRACTVSFNQLWYMSINYTDHLAGKCRHSYLGSDLLQHLSSFFPLLLLALCKVILSPHKVCVR